MARFFLHCLWLVSLLSYNLVSCRTITDDEKPRRTYPSRRAIDGTRGRKYYVADEDNPFDSYGSSGGQYDPYEEETDLSDIRNNVPGEPGVDYPSYTRLPQTGFVCEGHFKGYYADEAAGCQVFHVCDGNFLVSSFLCPIGSIFSQKLLTCDWWSKVDCSSTKNYHPIETQNIVMSEVNDEILPKVPQIEDTQSVNERIPDDNLSLKHQPLKQDRRQRIFDYSLSGSDATERINHLLSGQENYSDYPSRLSSRYKSTSGQNNHKRNEESNYYSENVKPEVERRNENPRRIIHTINNNNNNRKNNHQDESLNNKFESSYDPILPIETTTARKYYSPTVPTTYRPSTATRTSDKNYDLDFESSDHLYTARGRSEEIIKAATPPSFVNKNESPPEVENFDTLSLVSKVDEGTKKNYNVEESESESFNDKINLPIDEIHENYTKIETLNRTIISLNDKEIAIDKDLNRLMKKINETISILTIDDENRAEISHEQDEQTGESEKIVKKIDNIVVKKNENIVKSFAEPPTIVNSTNFYHKDYLKGEKKPAEFLEPPKSNTSQFRVTILNETSSKVNEKIANSEKLVKKNFTEKILDKGQEKIDRVQGKLLTVKALSTQITPPLLTGEKRESRIIQIFLNNSTNKNITNNSKINETLIEKKIESIDLTPAAILNNGNYSKMKIIPDNVLDKLEIVKSINLPFINLTTLAKFVSTTTPISTQNFTSDNNNNLKFDNSISIINEKLLSQESNVTKIDDKSLNNSTTVRPSEEANFEQLNEAKKIISNESNIDDSIEIGSSPFQLTLTVNKNEEIDPNGEIIRKLIAQQEIGDSIGAADYKSFEIVKSQEPQESHKMPDEINYREDSKILRNDRKLNGQSEISFDENLEKSNSDRLQSTNYLRSIVALVNAPNLPRPFSVESSSNVNIKRPSDFNEKSISTSSQFSQINENVKFGETTDASIHTTKFFNSSKQEESEKSLETLQASSSGFPREIKNHEGFLGEKIGQKEEKTGKEKLIFDLPDPSRMLNFSSGLRLSDNANTRINEQYEIEQLKKIQQLKKIDEEMKKFDEKIIVKTEFIPSIGFSLNTDEERNEYMDAVVKGLLPDVRAAETTKNSTNTSNELTV